MLCRVEIEAQYASIKHRVFLTPFVSHSNGLANLGSSRASIEPNFHKEFNFLGFVRYLSARIE